MNPHFPAFKRIITNPVLFQFFVFQKLSAAFWAGLSMAQFDEESCGVRVKLSWFNQNPFRSMYFAVEAMAAEMSCGMLAFGQVYKRQPAVSMLVEKLEAKFVKKATGVIIFTCADGLAFQQAVNDALENKDGSSPGLLKRKTYRLYFKLTVPITCPSVRVILPKALA
jgi:hypothetical protein